MRKFILITIAALAIAACTPSTTGTINFPIPTQPPTIQHGPPKLTDVWVCDGKGGEFVTDLATVLKDQISGCHAR